VVSRWRAISGHLLFAALFFAAYLVYAYLMAAQLVAMSRGVDYETAPIGIGTIVISIGLGFLAARRFGRRMSRGTILLVLAVVPVVIEVVVLTVIRLQVPVA
jgi:hypothetical protein